MESVKGEEKVTIEINENIIEKLKEIISLLENPPRERI